MSVRCNASTNPVLERWAKEQAAGENLKRRLEAVAARAAILLALALQAGLAPANEAPTCPTAASVHQCAKLTIEVIRTASSDVAVITKLAEWNKRFESELTKLRERAAGAEAAKTDIQLMKEAVLGELPDEKDAAKAYLKHAPLPKEWTALWQKIWKRYFAGLASFLNSPVTKALVIALHPSQTSSDYDELMASNAAVENAGLDRVRRLTPPSGMFMTTLTIDPYKKAEAKLLPHFRPVIPPPR